ncbi:MAG TPA: thiamine phosphate synthase [Herpetosiphonaceae bacterium]|nr:thiamine phosphate synthase [Herpetosiphonaceae bacterium]
MELTVDWSLYVLLDTSLLPGWQILEVAQQVLAGGATMLQLRAKNQSIREQMALAQSLIPLAHAHGVPLLINDHADIALGVGADGVHLGVDDLPVALARRILPPGALIGYSPEDIADAQRAVVDGVDYLGVGPFTTTATKGDAGDAIGPDGIAAIVTAVRVPVVAIGGITAITAGDAIRAGAAGIAVASAVVSAPDPAAATRALRATVADARQQIQR